MKVILKALKPLRPRNDRAHRFLPIRIKWKQTAMLPVDDIEAANIADELLAPPPQTGFLTISNALQWRLQYRRVIDRAGSGGGVWRNGK